MLEHPDFDTMTEAEIADWQYAHKDELDAELNDPEKWETVEVEVSPNLHRN